MIKEVKMFTVICDNCQKDANEDGEYSCYGDESFAEDSAIDSGWIKTEDASERHYCDNCFKGYDDDDNVIIDFTRAKNPK